MPNEDQGEQEPKKFVMQDKRQVAIVPALYQQSFSNATTGLNASVTTPADKR